MAKMQFTGFGTRNFLVVVEGDQTAGTWHIHNCLDDTTTLRFTGSEGRDAYVHLKEQWRRSRRAFEAACAGYEYHPCAPGNAG